MKTRTHKPWLFWALFSVAVFSQLSWGQVCHQAHTTALQTPSSYSRPVQAVAASESSREILTNHLLVLSNEQYRQAVEKGSLPPDSILVLESLPLDVDLPLVAAIVISNPIASRYSHPERQATALEIPILVSNGIFHDSPLSSLIGRKGFRLELGDGQMKIEALDRRVFLKSKFRSVLPTAQDRSKMVIVPWSDAENFPTARVGEKFKDLASIESRRGKHLGPITPHFLALTSGYYEKFLDTYGIEQTSLRRLRDRMLNEIDSLSSAERGTRLEGILARFQEAVLHSKSLESHSGSDVFDELFNGLRAHFAVGTDLFFRSNSDFEGLLNTSGLFRSVGLRLDSADSLRKGVQEMVAAMSTPRSFQIRQFLGLIEKNISMPILVHPYINPVLGHGLAHLSQANEYGRFDSVHVSLVLGSDGKATNPSESHQVLYHSESESSQDRNPIMKKALDFIKQQSGTFSSEAWDRMYAKGDVDIEFVVVPVTNAYGRPDSQVILLQYSAPLSQETSIQVLRGELPLAQIERRKTGAVPESAEDLRRISNMKSFMEAAENPGSSLGARFALIRFKNRPAELIFWTNGIPHDTMEKKLKSYDTEYLAEGYLKQKGASFEFTPGWIRGAIGLSWESYQELFLQAVQGEIQASPKLKAKLQSLNASQPIVLKDIRGRAQKAFTSTDLESPL